MPVVESIPDPDAIHRQIDFPLMYGKAQELIWVSVFAFPEGQSESAVWGKYAPTDERVHQIGRERIAAKQQLRPEYRYIGFISSTAAAIRKICTAAGHGFSVEHSPAEGIHHAEIFYKPANNRAAKQLTKNEKVELKAALRSAFGDVTRDPLRALDLS